MGIFKHDDETDSNRPEDKDGDGPVTLEDRTEPGGQGSPGSNQSKTEPMSPTGTHSEPLAVPDLADMNVGAADPQAPGHPAAAGSGPSVTGGYAHEPVGQVPTGTEKPVQHTSGVSHRAPGLDGITPDGEAVETDVQAGAARMGPQALDSTASESPGQGDDASVPIPGDTPSPGTSEEHRVVAGIKLPDADETS